MEQRFVYTRRLDEAISCGCICWPLGIPFWAIRSILTTLRVTHD